MLDTLVLNTLLPSNPWSTYDILPWQGFAKNQVYLSNILHLQGDAIDCKRVYKICLISR
jgi:hypothetical protein